MLADELVFELIAGFVMSEAVIVAVPAVWQVTLKVWVPPVSEPLAGKVAFASLEVIAHTSDAVLIGFQLASTALTVTLNELPAVCAIGVPVFPVALPATAVSPGNRTCNLAKL